MNNPETGTYPRSEAILNRLTLVTRSERAALVGWFARQGEATQLEAMSVQSDLLRKSLAASKKDPEAAELRRQHSAEHTFACIILAISLFRRRASVT
jgi:hypothetical protein